MKKYFSDWKRSGDAYHIPATKFATASSASLNSLCPLDYSVNWRIQQKKQLIWLNQQKSCSHVICIMSVCHLASAGISHSATSNPVAYTFALNWQLYNSYFSFCFHCHCSWNFDTCIVDFSQNSKSDVTHALVCNWGVPCDVQNYSSFVCRVLFSSFRWRKAWVATVYRKTGSW